MVILVFQLHFQSPQISWYYVKCLKCSLTSTNSTCDTKVGLVCMKKFNVLQVVLDSKGEAESSFCRTELAHQRLVLKKITIIGFSTPMGSGVELQYKFIKSPISHYFQLCFTLKMWLTLIKSETRESLCTSSLYFISANLHLVPYR